MKVVNVFRLRNGPLRVANIPLETRRLSIIQSFNVLFEKINTVNCWLLIVTIIT